MYTQLFTWALAAADVAVVSEGKTGGRPGSVGVIAVAVRLVARRSGRGAERVMREIVEVAGSQRAPAGRYVALPGRGRTFVRELPGPDGAPTVVLLHGWTTTAALNWSSSFGPLSRHFRVIALDHRGHGRGLRSSSPFRLEDCADDVAALLDSLGIERCIAAGYSMGGPIAQLLRRRHPGLVGGLVLCATSASFHGTRREWLLSGLATGGCLLAAAPPTRPALAAAMTVRGCFTDRVASSA